MALTMTRIEMSDICDWLARYDTDDVTNASKVALQISELAAMCGSPEVAKEILADAAVMTILVLTNHVDSAREYLQKADGIFSDMHIELMLENIQRKA